VLFLLGGNGNALKITTTAKLNSKQTSVATVRDLYQMYDATFLTPPLVLITMTTFKENKKREDSNDKVLYVEYRADV
jgi:hypothetical protein